MKQARDTLRIEGPNVVPGKERGMLQRQSMQLRELIMSFQLVVAIRSGDWRKEKEDQQWVNNLKF